MPWPLKVTRPARKDLADLLVRDGRPAPRAVARASYRDWTAAQTGALHIIATMAHPLHSQGLSRVEVGWREGAALYNSPVQRFFPGGAHHADSDDLYRSARESSSTLRFRHDRPRDSHHHPTRRRGRGAGRRGRRPSSLLETAHLLRSPKNAARLLTALNRAL